MSKSVMAVFRVFVHLSTDIYEDIVCVIDDDHWK